MNEVFKMILTCQNARIEAIEKMLDEDKKLELKKEKERLISVIQQKNPEWPAEEIEKFLK